MSTPLQREFNRLVMTCKEEGVAIPAPAQVQRKREAIKTYEARPLTDVGPCPKLLSDSI